MPSYHCISVSACAVAPHSPPPSYAHIQRKEEELRLREAALAQREEDLRARERALAGLPVSCSRRWCDTELTFSTSTYRRHAQSLTPSRPG